MCQTFLFEFRQCCDDRNKIYHRSKAWTFPCLDVVNVASSFCSKYLQAPIVVLERHRCCSLKCCEANKIAMIRRFDNKTISVPKGMSREGFAQWVEEQWHENCTFDRDGKPV